MNYFNLIKDIQTKLVTNSAGVKVWREQFVPPDPDRTTGYIAFDFTPVEFQQCNIHFTGIVEGILDVTAYSLSDAIRSTLTTSILDLWMPVVSSKRTQIGPVSLTNCYLHWIYLQSQQELFQEKTGHPTPETVGNFLSFNLKASITE